jgi:hypothetical protein
MGLRWILRATWDSDLTCAETLFQNGISERKNRTVLEMTRSLLLHAVLPQSLWEEATRTAVYILNRVPTRPINMVTLFERLTGKLPNLKHFRVFGCSVSVLYKKAADKLSPKSFPTVFVGYDDQSKAYGCYDSSQHKIYVSRNVEFEETNFHVKP